MFAISAFFTNPWIFEYLLYQSSIHTASQANTIHAFACGNPTHNLEVVSTPKPTTITLLLAMSIFSQSRLGVCKQLPFLSWSVLLSHCNMLLTSILFKHRPRRQQQPVCLGLRPPTVRQQHLGQCAHSHYCMSRLMAAIPCIPLVLSASKGHLGMGFCNATKPNWRWFRLHHNPFNFFSFGAWLSLFCPCCDSSILLNDLSVLQHISTPILNPSMACQRPPSVIVALCCVLWPRPSLICAGHVLAPAASIFILWFSPWPPSWLQAGALLSPHPGGRRTHLSHFGFLPAMPCMFSGAAERNNVAWRNFRSPSQHTLSRVLPAPASPESDVGSHSLKP